MKEKSDQINRDNLRLEGKIVHLTDKIARLEERLQGKKKEEERGEPMTDT